MNSDYTWQICQGKTEQCILIGKTQIRVYSDFGACQPKPSLAWHDVLDDLSTPGAPPPTNCIPLLLFLFSKKVGRGFSSERALFQLWRTLKTFSAARKPYSESCLELCNSAPATRSFHDNRAPANQRPEICVVQERVSTTTVHWTAWSLICISKARTAEFFAEMREIFLSAFVLLDRPDWGDLWVLCPINFLGVGGIPGAYVGVSVICLGSWLGKSG